MKRKTHATIGILFATVVMLSLTSTGAIRAQEGGQLPAWCFKGSLCNDPATCPDPSDLSGRSCSDYDNDIQGCFDNADLPSKQVGWCTPGDYFKCSTNGATPQSICDRNPEANSHTCGFREQNCEGVDKCLYNAETGKCVATDSGSVCSPAPCVDGGCKPESE